MKKSANSTIFYVGNNVPVKIGKNFGIGCIIASFFFLFNPNMAVFDVLPDIIGYILMSIGLSKLALINDSFDLAQRKFKNLIYVEIGKVCAILVMFSLFDAKNREYAFLLHTFSFLVIDLIFAIPAFKNLYEGFEYVTERYKSKDDCAKQMSDGEKYEESKKEKKERTITERILKYTIAFVILKPLLTTLPEFIVLGRDEYVNNNFLVHMYDFIYHYRILAILVVLVLGIIWLVRSCKYFCGLIKDKNFIDFIKSIFTEKVLPREGVFVRRTLKTALAFLMAGAIFSVDMHISELNFMPDALSAVFFLLFALTIRYYVKSYKKLAWTSGIYAFASIIASGLKIGFLSEFSAFSAINHEAQAVPKFYVMCGASVLENIMFLVMVVYLLACIREIIQNYTGYVSIRTDYTSESRLKAIHKALSVKLWIVGIFAILGAVSASVFDFLLPERHYFAQIFWLIDFALQGIFAVSVVHEALAIDDEVESRYMLS